MNILLIFFIITLLYECLYKTKRSLHMLQQNLYNENNRYVKWQLKNKKDFFAADILLIILSIIELIVLNKYKMLSDIGLIIIAILQVAIGFKWHNIIKNNQDKLNDKLTISSVELSKTEVIVKSYEEKLERPILSDTYYNTHRVDRYCPGNEIAIH